MHKFKFDINHQVGSDDYRVFIDHMKDFIKSANLENTEHLVFMGPTGDEVVKALLAKSHTLKALKNLRFMFNNFSVEGIEAFAQLEYLLGGTKTDKFNAGGIHTTVGPSSNECKIFYGFLKEEYSKNQPFDIADKGSIKKMIFDIARADNNGDSVKYILEQPDKYPFLINSRDGQGHTLLHFYTHSPEMQEFLFKHGLIPEKEPERDTELQNILQDRQSVHLSSVTKRTYFTTKKLVEFIKASKDELEQAATSYMENAPKLLQQYQKNQMKVKLLGLTENGKKLVMGQTLLENAVAPDDKEFIEITFKKVEEVLEQKYLSRDQKGEYIEAMSRAELRYDYTRDDAKVTIPESIGYIKLLIDRFPIPFIERKELLVTLADQNPELVKKKLSKIRSELGDGNVFQEQITNREEFYKLLNDVDADKVNKLFEEISGFNIEETWREQKEFVLLQEIYEAATTYSGEDANACTQGTWSHIINSTNQIDLNLKEQCDQYLEEERKLEKQQNSITEENITPFVENLAGKLIQYAKDNPEFRENLVDDFVMNVIHYNEPKKIGLGQQKVLAKINQEFTASIQEFLPNYDRSIPKMDEYVIIINELCKVKAVQDFSLNTEEACVTSAVDNGSTLKSDNDPKNAQPENLVTNGESILTLEQENDTQDNSKRPGSSSKDDVTKNDNVIVSVSSNNNHSDSSKIQLDESRADSNQVSDQSTGHITQMDDEQAPLNDGSSKLESNQQNLQSEVLHASESVDKNSSKKDSKRVSNAQGNSKQPSYSGKNHPAPQNARSKLPVIAASMLAITGVATGIAIAVYLEMLAVGIAVVACCLVAAVIIYYCNKPSKSLENSNAQMVTPKELMLCLS